MKFNKSIFLILLFTITSGVILKGYLDTYTTVSSLQKQLDTIQYKLDYLSSDINSEMSMITEIINKNFSSKTTLIADYSFEISNANPLKEQCTLKLHVTPKTYKQGMKVFFSFTTEEGLILTTEAAFQPNYSYIATISIPFSNQIKPFVTFDTGTEKHSEALEEIYDLKKNYTLDSKSTYEGGCNIDSKEIHFSGQVVTYLDFHLDSNTEKPFCYPISGTINLTADDKIVYSCPIDLEAIKDSTYSGPIQLYQPIDYVVPNHSTPTSVKITVILEDNFNRKTSQTIYEDTVTNKNNFSV